MWSVVWSGQIIDIDIFILWTKFILNAPFCSAPLTDRQVVQLKLIIQLHVSSLEDTKSMMLAYDERSKSV